jgi:maleate isomerase
MIAALPTPRTRIGLIIPSSNRLTEPQMHSYAPDGVEVHVTRLRMTGASHVPLAELIPRIVESTRALDDARCDVIVFHCTASSMEAGLEGERQVLHAMRTATNAHVATTATATSAALRTLGANRIILISPYVAATHQHEIDFLTESGLNIVGGRCLGLPGSDEYIAVTPEDWLNIAKHEITAAAEAVFLSCTNIHSPQAIQPLEAAIHRPVVTSNQAVLWYALRACGQSDALPHLGRLFQLQLPNTDAERLSAVPSVATIT